MENEKKSTLKVARSVDFCRACYLYDLAADEAANDPDPEVTAAEILTDMDLSSERPEVLEILFTMNPNF